ncbi:MAG: hypothetical protein WC459_02265 [Patescibacteria group bacterium]
MAAIIIRFLNFFVLVVGLGILYLCQKANPVIFSLGSHIITQIWITTLFVYFALSAINKLLMVFNRIYPFLSLASFIVLVLFLLQIFSTLFVNLPPSDSSYSGFVILVIIGWLIWDVFMLTIYAHSAYETENMDSDQR